MGRLSDERTWELLREPIISFITTLRADGTPHVTPVWHMVEGGEIVIAVARDTVKARNVRRNPAVALCAAADASPQPWALVNGEARLSDDGAADFVRAVSAHYLGADEAKPIRRGRAGEDRLYPHARLPDAGGGTRRAGVNPSASSRARQATSMERPKWQAT